ncbi:MAG: hypothetical protein HFH56_05045 [Lachnospiraceae bacterium]|nr:hypothetical protein [Lachnospiraceae bacterium]
MAKMTLDETGRKYLVEIGLEPIGNRAILVEYAPNDNLGDKLAHFFSSEPYILQMCKNELVLIPMHMRVVAGTVAYYSLENKVALQLSYSSIRSVEITEKGLNHMVSITTDTDTIRLQSPKKGVSSFMGSTGAWHINNIDDTLQMLKGLQVNKAIEN